MKELTTTEKHLAVAQIVDRLTKFNLAQNSITDFATHKTSDDDAVAGVEIIAERKRLCAEHDIPEDITGIDPQDGEIQSGFIKAFLPEIKRWVSGSLHPHDVELMMEEIGEFHHANIAWAFLGKYDPDTIYPWGTNYELFSELVQLGSRKWKSGGKRIHDGEGNPRILWTGACGYSSARGK